MSRPAARWALAAILLASLVVSVFPLWWDLPSSEGWAYDELTPRDVRDGTRDLLNGRQRTRYPPLHYLLLSSVHRSADFVLELAGVELSKAATRTVYQVAGRSLSVMMALLIVWLVYRSARLMFDRGTSVLAAACAAVVCPFLYYAKTANLDVPYLFWFSLAVLFFIKVLQRHRLRDYLILAVAAALSVCTKDQAFALFVLAPLPLIVSLRTERRTRGQSSTFVATLLDRRMLLAGLTVAIVFSSVHNLLFDWRGFVSHVDAMRAISGRSHEFTNNLAGHVALLGQNIRNTAFSFGLPLFLVAIVGVVWALTRRRSHRDLVSLLIFPISYHLFFIAIARYSYDRFMLPVTFVLCFFAAPVLAWIASRAPVPRWVGVGATSALLLYTLAYAFSIDLTMNADSRVLAQAWLNQHARSGDSLLSVGSGRQAIQGHRRTSSDSFRNSGPIRLRNQNPRFVVVLPAHLNPETYRDLLMGRLNYRRVARFERDPLYSLLDFDGVRSNLESVNPRVEIFERVAAWGPRPAEIRQEIEALLHSPDKSRRAALTATLLNEPVLSRRRLTGEFLVGVGLDSFWTDRSPLAALVARNPSNRVVRPAIRVWSRRSRGGQRSIIVDDGEEQDAHGLQPGGTVRLRLAPVPPGEDRLYLLTMRDDSSARLGGVRIEGPRLQRIGETGMEATGLASDGWTLGQPVVATWSNVSGEPRALTLGLACWAPEADLPITVSVAGLHGEKHVTLETAGIHELSLWEVPAFSDEILILSTDRTWREPGGERQLGVQLLPPDFDGH